MHAVALERVEVRGKGPDERLALAGAHLRDLSLMQRDATHELHVEVAHAEHAPGRITHDGEGFRKDLVYRRARGDLRLQLRSFRRELRVRELLHRGLEHVD